MTGAPAAVAAPRTFRFRPRLRGVAVGAIALGVGLVALGLVAATGAARPLAIVGGATGVLLGVLYLASPAWRLVVQVDDDGLEVRAGARRRFRLAWAEIVAVGASPTTHTCFVDGGAPERSLLVPGDGAPAAYDLEDKATLYAAIVAHVTADRIREVELLENA